MVACALLVALAVALVTYNAFKPSGFALDENNVADDVVRTTLSGKFDTNNDGNIDEYVPTKVETPSGTYSQDVESATKVNSLSVPYSTYNFSYGSDGLLTNSIEKSQSARSDTTTTFNWENNLLTAETSTMSSYTNKYTCTYKNSSEYESVQADYSNSKQEYTLSTSGLTTTMNMNASSSNTTMPYKVWTKDSSGKVVTFIEYGGNGHVYNKHEYTWNGELLVSETVSNVTAEEGSWNLDNGTTSVRYSVDYSYTDGQLTKATYNTGATQEFTYTNGLLSSVNTTVPDSDTSGLKAGTTNITYKTVLGIKGKTALSFINLPGTATGGFVNKEPSAKLIELTDTYYGGYISRLQPSFNGQFWWNEEGIIDYQKTMAELKAQSSQTQNESQATQSDANNATKTNEEAHAAYKSTIEAVKTGQDGSSSSSSRKDAPCATYLYSASYEDGKYYLDYQKNKTEVSKE